MNLTVDPVYQNLVHAVTPEEYESMKESIKKNGLWLPIIVNEKGIILDGHTRYKICKELGIPLKHAERKFENEWVEKKFVIESNLRRRQLNDFQKSELGIPLQRINQEISKLKIEVL